MTNRRREQTRPRRRGRLLPILVFGGVAVGIAVALLPQGSLTLSWGKLLHATGNSKSALQAVRDIPPQNVAVQLFRARVLFDIRQYDECRRILLDVGPETPADIRMLGHALARTGRWSEAIPVLEISREQGDDSMGTMCLLADGYANLGEYEKSAVLVDELSAAGAEADALFRGGLLDREENDIQSFITKWTKLLPLLSSGNEIPIEEWQVRELVADACLSEGRIDEADAVISKSRETTDQARILGNVANSRGESAAAVEHWQRALELNASNAAARESLAAAFVAERRFQDAINVLDPIEIDEKDLSPRLCQLYQFAFAGLGDGETATEWQQRHEQATKRAAQVERLYRLIRQQGLPAERAVRAWKLAAAGNLVEAKKLVTSLEQQIPESAKNSNVAEFIRALSAFIRGRQELPDPLEFLADDEPVSPAEEDPQE